MVKLKTPSNLISIDKFKDGQIAEIVSTCGGFLPTYNRRIVQRYGDVMISIGRSSGNSWPDIFSAKSMNKEKFFVRLLEAGESIEVESND